MKHVLLTTQDLNLIISTTLNPIYHCHRKALHPDIGCDIDNHSASALPFQHLLDGGRGVWLLERHSFEQLESSDEIFNKSRH